MANPPVAGTPVSIAMPLDLPGAATGCNQADVRPFGLHTDSLGVWATLTCTGPAASNLRGYVYRYDETTGAWDSQPAVEFSLGGNRGKAWTGAFGANNANWRAWADNFAAGVSGSSYSDAQPLLSDLEFDSNGDMSIGIKDRTGDRVGMDAGNLTTGSTTTYEGFNAGDLLRACVSGSTWVIENNGSCGSRTGYGAGNNQGPGGGEFYHDDYPTTGSSSHQQSMLGTAEQVPGFTNLVATSYDPLSNVRVSGFRNVSNTNGANVSGVEVTGDGRGNQTTCPSARARSARPTAWATSRRCSKTARSRSATGSGKTQTATASRTPARIRSRASPFACTPAPPRSARRPPTRRVSTTSATPT